MTRDLPIKFVETTLCRKNRGDRLGHICSYNNSVYITRPNDNALFVYNIHDSSLECLGSFNYLDGVISCISISRDGKNLIIGFTNGYIVFYNIQTSLRTILTAHTGTVRKIITGRKGYISYGRDNTFVLFNKLDDACFVRAKINVPPLDYDITDIAYHNDSDKLFVSCGIFVYCYKSVEDFLPTVNPTVLKFEDNTIRDITCMTILGNVLLMYDFESNNIGFWNIHTSLYNWKERSIGFDILTMVATSDSEHVIIISRIGCVYLFCVLEGGLTIIEPLCSKHAETLVVSRDGRHVIVASAEGLLIAEMKPSFASVVYTGCIIADNGDVAEARICSDGSVRVVYDKYRSFLRFETASMACLSDKTVLINATDSVTRITHALHFWNRSEGQEWMDGFSAVTDCRKLGYLLTGAEMLKFYKYNILQTIRTHHPYLKQIVSRETMQLIGNYMEFDNQKKYKI